MVIIQNIYLRIMKKTITLIAALLAMSATASAQQEYLFREHFDEKVSKIEIHSGWPVKLVSRTDDSTFVCFVSSDSIVAQYLSGSQAFTYNDKTLTLSRSDVPLRGCSVEIHANFENMEFLLMPGAIVKADNLTIKYTTITSFELKEGSSLELGRLHCIGHNTIKVHDASLVIDTLSGDGLTVDVYGNGQVLVNHYQQEELNINLKRGHGPSCYSFPDKSLIVNGTYYLQKCEKDTIHHIIVTDENKTKWDGTLTVFASPSVKFHSTSAGWSKPTGWITNISGAPTGSPYASAMNFELDVPFLFNIQLNPRWKIKTGWNFRFEFTPMSHKVKVDQNGLLMLADDADHFSNIATSSYNGIPINVIWSPAKSRLIDFGVDLFAGINCGSRLWQNTPISEDQSNILRITSDKTSYLNPFKLELGFSILQRFSAGINKIRFYTNLLPDYRNLPDLPKCRTYGVEINF